MKAGTMTFDIPKMLPVGKKEEFIEWCKQQVKGVIQNVDVTKKQVIINYLR